MFGSDAMFVEYVIVKSLLIRRAAVRRAVGAEPAPATTGLISNRLNPKSLFVAREIGALIKASVNTLAAVPRPDCARTDPLLSVEVRVPGKSRDTTSASGSPGFELTLVCGCESGPSIEVVTR